MKTLTQFASEAGLSMTCKRVESRPGAGQWGKDARHWSITIRKANAKAFRVTFSQGSAHTKEPTLSEVLDCLAMDCAGFENAGSYAEWIKEYGEGKSIFETIRRQAVRLHELLGDTEYGELLWNCERE